MGRLVCMLPLPRCVVHRGFSIWGIEMIRYVELLAEWSYGNPDALWFPGTLEACTDGAFMAFMAVAMGGQLCEY